MRKVLKLWFPPISKICNCPSLSIFTSGFQGITGAESIIRLFAINSNAFNTLVTFNSNNGIDNSEIKNAKDSMGD
jgi:hypothetical protein